MLRGIPVLASDIGGLPEAKLGVDFVLPVVPGEFREDGFVSPPQDLSPWSQALGELLFDEDAYQQCSQQSRQAAHDFVASVSVSRFEALLDQLAEDR
jgi:glycosyltransferase involved in cell wall biosynthesis